MNNIPRTGRPSAIGRRFALHMFSAAVLVAGLHGRHGQTMHECQGAEDEVISPLRQSWEETSRANARCRIEWIESRVTPRGTLPGPGGYGSGVPFLAGAPPSEFPPSDVRHELWHEILLDGERMRYRRRGPAWVSALGRFVDQEYTSAWDGSQSTAIDSAFPRDGSRTSPAFLKFEIARNPDARSRADTQPALILARPADPLYSPLLGGNMDRAFANFSRVGSARGGEGQGIDFGQFVHPHPRPLVVIRVEPRRGMRVVRYTWQDASAQPWMRVEYRYSQDPSPSLLGWRLSSWQFSGKQLRRQSECRVVAWERDPDISARAFTLAPPPGAPTIPADDLSNERLLEGEVNRRLSLAVHPQRRQDSVEGLFGGRSWWPMALLLTVMVVALAVFLCWRRCTFPRADDVGR